MGIGLSAGLAAVVLAGAALAAPAGAPDISTLNPSALKALIPADLVWAPAAGLTGTETAVLVGDPDKPGFYVLVNRFHAGNFSHPHYHANNRYIMVLSGTWWVSTKATWDPEHDTVPLRAGTFVTHTARQVHYDGARAGGEDAVVMIFGQGPGTLHRCDGPDAETGPGRCADAKAAQGAK